MERAWKSSDPAVTEYATMIGRNDFTLDELIGYAEKAKVDYNSGESQYIQGKAEWFKGDNWKAQRFFDQAKVSVDGLKTEYIKSLTAKMFGLDYGIFLIGTMHSHKEPVSGTDVTTVLPGYIEKGASDDEIWVAMMGNMVRGDYAQYFKKDLVSASRPYHDALSAFSTQKIPWNVASEDLKELYIANLTELTNVHVARSMPKDVLQDLDELLKLRPDIAENWAYRGNILEDLGYQKDAFADYSQAISLGMEQIKSRNFDNEFIGLISDVCFAYAFLAKNFKMYSSAKEALATTIEMYKLRADLGDNMARSRLPSLESELRLWTSEINQIYARQQQQRIQQEQQQRARQEQQQMEAARLAMQNRSAGSSSFSGSSSGQSRQRAIYASGPSAPPQALQSYQLNEVRRNREHHVSTHHYVAERIESARSSVGSAVRTPMRVRHMPHRPAPMMLRH